MQDEFNQHPAELNHQLFQLIEELRAFSYVNATKLSFDNFATLGEIANQAELYNQCLKNNDWNPVIKNLLSEAQMLLNYLKKEAIEVQPATSEFNG